MCSQFVKDGFNLPVSCCCSSVKSANGRLSRTPADQPPLVLYQMEQRILNQQRKTPQGAGLLLAGMEAARSYVRKEERRCWRARQGRRQTCPAVRITNVGLCAEVAVRCSARSRRRCSPLPHRAPAVLRRLFGWLEDFSLVTNHPSATDSSTFLSQ